MTELLLGRLEGWMRDHIEGFRGPLAAEEFEGGQSNPTYRLASGAGPYVLRRKPLGRLLPSAHAVDREYRVIRALAGNRPGRGEALVQRSKNLRSSERSRNAVPIEIGTEKLIGSRDDEFDVALDQFVQK